jgi:hypothetical protein
MQQLHLLIKKMTDNVRLKSADFERLLPYRLIVRPDHRFLAIMTSKSRGTEGSKEGETERCRGIPFCNRGDN